MEARDGDELFPGCVHLVPAGLRATLAGNTLSLVPPVQEHSDGLMPIDRFFQSLASERRRGAIGVLLSGSVRDGTLGLGVIKAKGGRTLAQSPQSAEHNTMPRSAILAGVADEILDPAGIAGELSAVADPTHPTYAGAREEERPAELSGARLLLAFQQSQVLAAIVESAEDAIIRKTLEGVITHWNRGAERLYGYTRDEAVGSPISLIIPEDRLEEEEEILARLRRGERIEHRDTIRVRRDGRRVPVSLSISPIRDASGRVIGAAKIARDISERTRAEEERTKLLAELQSAVEARDSFLSIASHELRTPLNTLKLKTQRLHSIVVEGGVMKMGREDLASRLAAIDRQADRIAYLIEQLLDVSRITGGTLELELEEVELMSLAREVVARFEEGAERAGCGLELSGDEPIPGTWDRARLDQVLSNLISNALKYGAGKPVEVTVRRHPTEAEILVCDHGIGVAREDQKRMFERFERLVAPQHFGGLGLGLWIVAQIVRAHGGSIHIESSPGAGACFSILLPNLVRKPR